MAAKGYVVLYPNPRGSTSYGQDFANIIQYQLPGRRLQGPDGRRRRADSKGLHRRQEARRDRRQRRRAADHWTVTQTQRFAAAVAQRDITNWADWWYTADFRQFEPSWFKGAPFDQEEDFKAGRRSRT